MGVARTRSGAMTETEKMAAADCGDEARISGRALAPSSENGADGCSTHTGRHPSPAHTKAASIAASDSNGSSITTGASHAATRGRAGERKCYRYTVPAGLWRDPTRHLTRASATPNSVQQRTLQRATRAKVAASGTRATRRDGSYRCDSCRKKTDSSIYQRYLLLYGTRVTNVNTLLRHLPRKHGTDAKSPPRDKAAALRVALAQAGAWCCAEHCSFNGTRTMLRLTADGTFMLQYRACHGCGPESTLRFVPLAKPAFFPPDTTDAWADGDDLAELAPTGDELAQKAGAINDTVSPISPHHPASTAVRLLLLTTLASGTASAEPTVSQS